MTGFDLQEIDRIGERLRSGVASEADYGVLDGWRRSFEHRADIVGAVFTNLGIEFARRTEKSDASIIAKLRRGQSSGDPLRLSLMQDIAGLRIVCADLKSQDEIVALLKEHLQGYKPFRLVDRRRGEKIGPSGYRAVHVVLTVDARPIEIQLRTKAQDLWANVCEQLAYELDPGLRYGAGPRDVLRELAQLSQMCAEHDADGAHWPHLVIEALSLLLRYPPSHRYSP